MIAALYPQDSFRRDMRRMRLAMAGFTLGTILSSLWALLVARHHLIMSALVEQYDSHDIPRALLPFLAASGTADRAYLLISLIRAASALAFLLAMTSAHRMTRALRGTATSRWSWRWTILSCFVPGVNFIFPWLGFTELYRQALDRGLQMTLGRSGLLARLAKARRHAGKVSILIAVMIFITTLVFIESQVIYNALQDDVYYGWDPQPDYAFFVRWLLLEAVTIAATGAMILRYLQTMRLALDEAGRQASLDIFG